MTEYTKPIPFPDNVTSAYWDAAGENKLLIQQCIDCGTRQFFPQSYCRNCLGENIEWIEASGKGKVYTFTIVKRPPTARFQEDVPYVVALIELEEGVRMMSNVVEIYPDDVRVDMPVEVVFDKITSAISLPKFRPIAKA
jgi:uncharacterized OB-fold protein